MIYAKVLRENKVLNITNEMLLRTNNQQKDNDIAVNPKDAVVIVLKECGGELG